MLMMLLMMTSCVVFFACSDDDDNGAQSGDEQQDNATAFWSVVSQLTSADQMTDDYQGKTFEPTIGEPSEGNANIRIVATNDLETAAQRFATLVGVDDVDANTTSRQWSSQVVGTLNYQKTEDGSSLATVDVNIPQMPHLQQIVYCTPEQMGNNASFSGVPYYRFGDVVKRVNDNGKTEYWVCVRPAYAPEGKKKSHWITLSPLPKKNIKTITKGGKAFKVPTLLGKNEEQTQNLAEMLYAMADPAQWYKNITVNSPYKSIFNKGVPMFHDFDKTKADAHGPGFWNKVQMEWSTAKKLDNSTIYELVTGFRKESFNSNFTKGNIRFLYDGYSWWSKVSWKLTLYETFFTNGEGKKVNMHAQTSRDLVITLSPDQSFDVEQDISEDSPYMEINDAYYYVIRHATGDELCGRTADIFSSFSQTNEAISDVYVYNVQYNEDYGEDVHGKTTGEEKAVPEAGNVIGPDGKFYTSHESAVAVVAYVGEPGSVETGTDYRGLAVALPQSDWQQMNFLEGSQVVRDCAILEPNWFDWQTELNGLANTEILTGGCGKGHVHTAALYCKDYKSQLSEAVRTQKNFSQWFLPSVGQVIKIMTGLGMEYNASTNSYRFVDSNDVFANHLKNGLDNLFSYNLFVSTRGAVLPMALKYRPEKSDANFFEVSKANPFVVIAF